MDTLANKISDSYYELSERDFYPPEDKRTFRSGVLNTDGDSYEEWDCSSNGRITALQAEGCGFKSHQFHFGCVAKRYGNWLLTSISKVQVLSHPLLLL